MKTINFHLKHVILPIENQFEDLVQLVIEQINIDSTLVNRPQKKIVKNRLYTARVMIEGLYQAYSCRSNKARLSVALNSHGYGKNAHQVHNHSHTVVKSVINAIQKLGWVEVAIGYQKKDGNNVISTLKSCGELLVHFQKEPYLWRAMEAKANVIILKNYDSVSRLKTEIPFTDNNHIRQMRKNLQKINHFLTQNAICLALDNWGLENLSRKMAQDSYEVPWSSSVSQKKARVFNFLDTQMRRIFSRSSFTLGGRFYGGWWQFIPRGYRQYITINGFPTSEVDFSEIHPRLMYWEANLEPPEGDLYDLGIRYDNLSYNKEMEPYKSKRKVIKRYLNTLLNDDKGVHKLCLADQKVLGLTTPELKALILQKHPIVATIIGKSKGLAFQYIDSQIAEKVMINLMEKGIVCLPIHDSFICPEYQVGELITTMNQCYRECLGAEPRLKDPEPFQTDFEPVLYPSGELNLTYMKNQAKKSKSQQFLNSYFEKKCQTDPGTPPEPLYH